MQGRFQACCMPLTWLVLAHFGVGVQSAMLAKTDLEVI